MCDAGAAVHQFSTCRERGLRREVRESAAKSWVVKPGASLLLEYLHSVPLDLGPNIAVSRVFSDVKGPKARTQSVDGLCTSDATCASEGFQWENKRGFSDIWESTWPWSMIGAYMMSVGVGSKGRTKVDCRIYCSQPSMEIRGETH